LRQPTAIDLRFITTAIKITGHLERIGDMAANIAEKAIQLNEEPKLKPYIDLPRMAELVGEMIKKSLDSFIGNDLNMAEEVRRMEQVTDDLNEQIFRELLTFMMEDSKTIHRSLMIMQVSKKSGAYCRSCQGHCRIWLPIWLPAKVCVINLVSQTKRSLRETQSFF